MKYSLIDKCELVNGEGVGVSLFTQGCPFHCKGCFNSSTWDFNGGKEWTEKEEKLILEYMKPDYIKRLTILGGEPLLERNIEPLHRLFTKVRQLYPDKQIWLYTGNKYEEVIKTYKDLISLIDIIIDGRFIIELKDLTLKFRGSSNQRIIDVQKSLQSGKIVLY